MSLAGWRSRLGPSSALGETALLGGRLTLLQPRDGYRVAIDTVLLAAAVEARPGDAVLDIGAGVGAAALALARRLPDVRVTGLEQDAALVRLARRNAEANGLADRVRFLAGDLAQPPAELTAQGFDHAMANPPYLEAGRGTEPPDADKAAATVERTPLADWLRFAHRMVVERGSVTVIHRADRLDRLLAAAVPRLGALVVYPLWPGPAPGQPGARPPKRILVQGRKGAETPLRIAPGMILHAASGAFTRAAEAVLRDGAALRL